LQTSFSHWTFRESPAKPGRHSKLDGCRELLEMFCDMLLVAEVTQPVSVCFKVPTQVN